MHRLHGEGPDVDFPPGTEDIVLLSQDPDLFDTFIDQCNLATRLSVEFDRCGGGDLRTRFGGVVLIEDSPLVRRSQIHVAGEIVLRDEKAVIPIGSYQPLYGVTLSLPSALGHSGVIQTFEPEMSQDERLALRRSAAALKAAVDGMKIYASVE